MIRLGLIIALIVMILDQASKWWMLEGVGMLANPRVIEVLPVRVSETESLRLLEATTKLAESRGEGRVQGLVGCFTAILNNGLGRYQEALTAAKRACEHEDLGPYRLALAELIEAGVRCGDREAAARGVYLASRPEIRLAHFRRHHLERARVDLDRDPGWGPGRGLPAHGDRPYQSRAGAGRWPVVADPHQPEHDQRDVRNELHVVPAGGVLPVGGGAVRQDPHLRGFHHKTRFREHLHHLFQLFGGKDHPAIGRILAFFDQGKLYHTLVWVL